jgi:DNA repair exonuclease SbcCD ATPase subunit
MSPETEHGFGTGLRAQLQRKQSEPEATEGEVTEPQAETEAHEAEREEQFVEQDRAFDDHVNVIVQASVPELAEIRAELEAALRREQEVRDALQHQIEAREHELEAARDLALREAETEQSAARVAAREAELERREQLLTDQLDQVANERRELNLHRTELVAEEARLAELGIHVDSMHADIESADHERAQAAADLARQLGMIAERERELKRERTELDRRRADTLAKEDALRTREEASGARERDLRVAELEIERIQARLQERAEAVAARETDTAQRLNKLEGELADREAALAAWEERVRTQADRAERERTGHGRAAQEAFALMAELERRENTLKLRETELAQSAAARAVDTRHTDEREELVSRGEANLATLRAELELRVEQMEKRELEVARSTTEMQERSDELRLREARLGAELELRAEKLDRLGEELAERDRRLSERERDLASYVGELQRTVA